MTEQQTPAETTVEGEQGTEQAVGTQPKPTETVDFWKQKAREQEKRAKENADAARRLAEIEEANKTAEQKAADKLAELARKEAELAAKEARADVSAATGLPAQILAGPTDHTPEAIKAFADLLLEHIGEKRGNNNHSPREGNNPPPGGGDPMRDFARGLFARATSE